MRILVYGAGVLGCNLARNLFHAGKDVTLLARGEWAEKIKKNGLRIKDKFPLRVSVSYIPVVTELAPDTQYDVIFVVLRYTQLDSALDTCERIRRKILFLWETMCGRERWRWRCRRKMPCLPLRFLPGIGRLTGWFPSIRKRLPSGSCMAQSPINS